MKKVSIIIPVYNVAEYLPKCLESAVGQSYKNTEIICVDDGSTDSSPAILSEFAEKDSRIRIIHQENQGLSGARNTGISCATGDYIDFLDGDDWIDLHTIGQAVDAAEKNHADVVMWGYVREFPAGPSEKKIFDSDKIFDKSQTKNLIQRRIVGLVGEELSNPENADAIVTAWGKLYRRDIITENHIEFVDTKLIGTEDALFNLYYFGFAEKSVFINKPFNHYRKDNETSLTKKYKPKLFSQWSLLYDKMQNYISGKGEAFETAFYNRVCLSMIGLGLNELCNPGGASERIKNIKKILSSERYVEAYRRLDMSFFPIHWKLFFTLCRRRQSAGVYALLCAIQFMIGR